MLLILIDNWDLYKEEGLFAIRKYLHNIIAITQFEKKTMRKQVLGKSRSGRSPV